MTAGQLITFEKHSLGASVQILSTTMAPETELGGGDGWDLPLLHSRYTLRAALGLCFLRRFSLWSSGPRRRGMPLSPSSSISPLLAFL